MLQQVTYNLKRKSKAILKVFIYNINTSLNSVEDTRKYFEVDVAMLADKKNTTTSDLLAYYNDKPDVVEIELIGKVY